MVKVENSEKSRVDLKKMINGYN